MKTKQLIFCFLLFVSNFINAQWSELGGANSLAANATVSKVCKDPSGNIYAVGDFYNSSGKYYVAKYNGISWSELGGANSLNANGNLYDICSDASGNIYVAGAFTNSSSKFYVAKFNGTNWSELGGLNGLSANYYIRSITTDGFGNIYAAGDFLNTNNKRYVAKFDGTVWNSLGGLNGLTPNYNSGQIKSICSDISGNIYASGNFTNFSGKRYVAKWDGSSWSELGGTNSLAANNEILTICSDILGNVYAAGAFSNSSGTTYIAKWDGIWNDISGFTGGYVYSLCSDNFGNIYAAGGLKNSNGEKIIAKFNGTSWSQLGNLNSLPLHNGAYSIPYSICIDGLGNICAGGNCFFNASGNYYVAKYSIPKIIAFSPNTASIGSTIILKGTNLTGTNRVAIGGQDASFYVINDSVISAVVPFTGNGSIQIFNDGFIGTLSGFTFFSQPNEELDNEYSVTGYFFHPISPRAINLQKVIHKVNVNTYETNIGDLGSSFKFQFKIDASNNLTSWQWVGNASYLLIILLVAL